MTWLIIIGVLILAIGPIFYLLPSAKDKRLVKLRERARRQGLNVRIAFLPKLDPDAGERVSAGGAVRETKIECTAYELPVGKRLRLDAFLIRRLPASPTILVYEVFPGWGTTQLDESNVVKRDRRLVEALAHAASQLPSDAVGLGFDARSVSCYWRERSDGEDGAIEQIDRLLKRLIDDLVCAFSGPSD
jgi:hypothetical protein